ncbi:hypothetical protein NHP164001_11570 [Helicobacter trogontum]|uniref:Uncharacterized protein n=1 Tax=Helicobacter trogontum TaxID=50960 RepID=A0ABQ0D476_9HELI
MRIFLFDLDLVEYFALSCRQYALKLYGDYFLARVSSVEKNMVSNTLENISIEKSILSVNCEL